MTSFKRTTFSSPFGSKSSDTFLPALAAINSSTTITFAAANGMTGTGVLIQMQTGTTALSASNTTYSGFAGLTRGPKERQP
jgi:hypothetical protein